MSYTMQPSGMQSMLESFGGGGGVEDASEESIAKLQEEVITLAEKVAECREQGPVAFAHLLEKSLAQMRSSIPVMDTQVSTNPTDGAEIEGEVASSNKEVLAQRAKLSERLASAEGSVSTLWRDIKSCQERLDRAITANRQTPAKTMPLHRAPVH